MNFSLPDESALSSLNWSTLIQGDCLSQLGLEPRNLIEAALHNAEDCTICLSPAQLDRLDARSFIRLVRDLAAEYATNPKDFEARARGSELMLTFLLGNVEFHVVFKPTFNQPGNLVVYSRLLDSRDSDASA